jgi:hypothetical protein
MTDPDVHHHLEIKEGEQTVAAADVTIPPETGTAQASLRVAAGQIPPGRRASLVDAVMDLPEVQDSTRLEAALPLGDAETLARLRERSENATTRAAGASALLDADIPGTEPGPPRLPPRLAHSRASFFTILSTRLRGPITLNALTFRSSGLVPASSAR